MLDKSKYQNKNTIGDTVRKSADSYFKGSLKGKGTPDVAVKRVFSRKIITQKGGGK